MRGQEKPLLMRSSRILFLQPNHRKVGDVQKIEISDGHNLQIASLRNKF